MFDAGEAGPSACRKSEWNDAARPMSLRRGGAAVRRFAVTEMRAPTSPAQSRIVQSALTA